MLMVAAHELRLMAIDRFAFIAVPAPAVCRLIDDSSVNNVQCTFATLRG